MEKTLVDKISNPKNEDEFMENLNEICTLSKDTQKYVFNKILDNYEVRERVDCFLAKHPKCDKKLNKILDNILGLI